jgi:hypothetical protein
MKNIDVDEQNMITGGDWSVWLGVFLMRICSSFW